MDIKGFGFYLAQKTASLLQQLFIFGFYQLSGLSQIVADDPSYLHC